jgi:amphi-Trp domain-containing protein
MTDRDVETIRSRARFVATLRRVADAIERKEPVRIQVAGKRLLAPVTATLSIEHEVEGANEELELQLRWQTTSEKQQPPAFKPTKRKVAKRRKAGRSKR